MLSALVLICSVAVAPSATDCTRENAGVVMRLPAGSGDPTTCLMQAQSLLAQTTIGHELAETDRVKILCRKSR